MAATDASCTETVTAQHEGRRYRIERGPGVTAGTVREFWPGRGLIGSQRVWLGDRHAARPTWYAAVNPTGQPYRATVREERLPSRRAAIRWLLARPRRRGCLMPETANAGPHTVLVCTDCGDVWEPDLTDPTGHTGCGNCGGWTWIGEITGPAPTTDSTDRRSA